MSLVITSTPASFAPLTGLSVAFLNMNAQQQAYRRYQARARLTVSDNPRLRDGEKVIVTLTDSKGVDNEVTFTALNNPTEAHHLPTTTTNTLLAYLSEVAEIMRSYYELSPFAVVQHGGDNDFGYIDIEASSAEVQGVTVQLQSPFQSKGATAYETKGAETVTGNAGQRVTVELFVENDDGTFTAPVSLLPPADRDGNIPISLDDVLVAELAKETPRVPGYAQNSYVTRPVRAYWLRFREESDAFTDSWSNTELHQTFQSDYDLRNISAEDSFLTRYPAARTIDAAQPEWLTWYNYLDYSPQLGLEVTIVDTEGNISQEVRQIEGEVAPQQAINIPVSMQALSIPTTASSYSVQMVDTSVEESNSDTASRNPDNPDPVLSGQRTYFVNCDNEATRYLQYTTAAGAPVTVRINGRTQQKLEVDRLVSRRVRTTEDRDYFQWKADFHTAYRYRTGYLTKKEVEALQELLIQNNAVDLKDGVPILITTSKFTIHEDFNFLYALEFDARVALNKVVVGVDGEVTGENWTEEANTDWETETGGSWETE